jgi:hypothetical protein
MIKKLIQISLVLMILMQSINAQAIINFSEILNSLRRHPEIVVAVGISTLSMWRYMQLNNQESTPMGNSAHRLTLYTESLIQSLRHALSCAEGAENLFFLGCIFLLQHRLQEVNHEGGDGC